MQLIRIELYKLFSQKVIYIAAAVFTVLYISQFYSGLPSAEQRALEKAASGTWSSSRPTTLKDRFRSFSSCCGAL